MSDLAACPFCGSNDALECHLNERREFGEGVRYAPELVVISAIHEQTAWAVYCHNCGIYGQPQTFGVNYTESDAKRDAVLAWNDRKPPWKEESR